MSISFRGQCPARISRQYVPSMTVISSHDLYPSISLDPFQGQIEPTASLKDSFGKFNRSSGVSRERPVQSSQGQPPTTS